MPTNDTNMKIETLAWTIDNKAELWTNTTPIEKNGLYRFSTSKNFPSDGLYFKTDKQFNGEMEDRLSLLYKQTIEKQENEEK
ncbi:unnamed protein product [Rotaria sp. Silwood2]|nr:unnamed protein product [Rotaria sp. Silwood2]CAF2882615.1 unnamed protein product [Rotaria sp. Silwood2]CAF4195819.1 unnamed protein product [Rotaria sp. Silwood2]CAF4298448.1 unnamed protein product [Rotaria sp. Silwood2]CAF4307954.1 unnamed protein product [Rotaria sp. Silwood2]